MLMLSVLKNVRCKINLAADNEPKAGLEPATYSLRMNCSTN